MAAQAAKAEPKVKTAPKRRPRYRGVVLQTPAAPPRTPLKKLQEAVEAAVAKNADALAGIK